MLKLIDNRLNWITMYRLVLYYLTVLILAAMVLGGIKIIPFSPLMIVYSSILITAICFASNLTFAKIFRAHRNVESAYITAFILVLLLTPPVSLSDVPFLKTAATASAVAMATKYILAIRRKHIFNPAAFGVAFIAFTLGQNASWWVGTLPMIPFIVAGGLLVTRKLSRFDLVFSFFVSALIFTLLPDVKTPAVLFENSWKMILNTHLLFLAFVMLTEPLTSPPKRYQRIIYGSIVGFLSAPWVHLGSFYFAPELALLAGNIFSYAVSPKGRLFLKLREKIKVASDV